jgi:hypothetical protein
MSMYALTPMLHLDNSMIHDPVLREVVRQVQTNFRETYQTLSEVIPATAKGSIAVGDGSKPVALSVGDDGMVLTADSSAPLGVLWAHPLAHSAILMVTADYLVQDGIGAVLVDASAGPVVITLPTVDVGSRIVRVKKVDRSGYMVTVQGQGASRIDGYPSVTMDRRNTAVTLQYYGDDWWIV